MEAKGKFTTMVDELEHDRKKGRLSFAVASEGDDIILAFSKGIRCIQLTVDNAQQIVDLLNKYIEKAKLAGQLGKGEINN